MALLLVASRPARAQTSGPDSTLLALLRRSSPELAARRAAVDAARARLAAAGFAGPVVLSLEGEEIPGGINLPAANLKLGVERELLSGGRRAAARAIGAAELRGAGAALMLAEQHLVAEGVRAAAQAAGAGRIASRLAAEDSLLQGAESALRARFSVGEARYVDVLRLRTERLRIQSDRAEALAESAAGRRALQTLLGTSGDSAALRGLIGMGFPAGADTLPPPPALDSLLAASGALVLGSAELERARALRALALAEQRPRITAAAGIQKFDRDGATTIGPTFGAQVSLPGTARAAGRAARAAADAEVLATEAQTTAGLAALRGALLAARDRYEAARARLALFDAALLRGARQEREAALASFGAGDLSLVELIDFERALSRAEIERVRARLDAADALADLYSAAAGADIPSHPSPSHDDDR